MDIKSTLESKPCFKAYSSANNETIIQLEEKLSLKFAQEYVEYLKSFGFVTYEGHELTGICKAKRLNVVDVTKGKKESNDNVPDDWYVIEQLNIDGIVVWQASSGEIYQTSPGGAPIKLCDSLAEYIAQF